MSSVGVRLVDRGARSGRRSVQVKAARDELRPRVLHITQTVARPVPLELRPSTQVIPDIRASWTATVMGSAANSLASFASSPLNDLGGDE